MTSMSIARRASNGVVLGIVLATILLTEMVTNNAAALLMLGLVLPWMHLLAAGWLTSLVVLGVGLLDARLKRRTRPLPG